jgi:hypothetical protein
MKEELHRHLDGELPLEGLREDDRGEAESWERLLRAFRRDMPGTAAPPWLETRVMAEIEALPEAGPFKRALSWLLAPRQVHLSPLTTGLVAVALAGILLVGRTEIGPAPSGIPMAEGVATLASGEVDDASPVVYVQFILEAPGATSVAVAGDFDGWEGTHGLQDPDGDGVWSGRVPVQPGVHAYMFVIDGSTWMTDPRADRYQDDGFGNRNAVLAVTVPNA